jgi:hypothetical protein
MTTQMAINMTRTTRSLYPALAGPAPLRAQARALHGGALPELWEARKAVPILARTISYLDSAAGEVVVVVVVVVKFPGLEGLSQALGVVRMAHHQCRQVRVGMVRVCVAGSRVTIGLIDGVGEMVVGARADLVVGVDGGMDQVVEWAVGVDVTELFTFYDLLSVGLAFLLSLVLYTHATLKGNCVHVAAFYHKHQENPQILARNNLATGNKFHYAWQATKAVIRRQ